MPLKAAILFGFLMAFTYAGYPLIALALSRIVKRPIRKRATPLDMTVILPVHNEGPRLAAKIENLLGQRYQGGSMRIVIVDDGSSDGACERLSRPRTDAISVVRLEKRGGKASALNKGMELATGDIVVLTDARQDLANGALAALAANFADSGVAAVTGRLVNRSRDAEGFFRRYEESIRSWESSWGSCAGATGALYAVRRECLKPLPAETILDDLVISLGATRYGRLVYERDAIAFESSESSQRTWSRRLRTLAGNWQMLFHVGRFGMAFSVRNLGPVVLHKALRLLFPFFATGFLISLALAAPAALSVAGGIFLAVLGLLLATRAGVLLPLKQTLFYVFVAPVYALGRYLAGRETVLWAK